MPGSPTPAAGEDLEEEVRAIEERSARAALPPGCVVFTGSSSIRMWQTLAADMAPVPVANHGFGGSQMEDVLRYAPRLVLRWRPRAVALYAGENDLEGWRGKSPESVLEQARSFAGLVAEAGASLLLLSAKLSPARRDDWPAILRYNALLRGLAAEERGREFVDVTTAALGRDGMPGRELFGEDGLHLSAAGYALWTSIVRPRLLALAGARSPDRRDGAGATAGRR